MINYSDKFQLKGIKKISYFKDLFAILRITVITFKYKLICN